MQIIPAIDIMDTQLVRLTKGDPSKKQSYDVKSPLEAAFEWTRRGAEMIHVIDLDAALGKTPNTELILEIARKVEALIQVGGGIRSVEAAQRLLDGGIERIILGSMLLGQPDESLALLDEYGSDRVVAALDHKDGFLVVKGWQESTKHKLTESLQAFSDQGYRWFLVTNVDHDGTLKGPDYETYSLIADKGKIIASGGVASIEDITRLKKTGVEAAVIGKALYEDRFTLEAASEAGRC